MSDPIAEYLQWKKQGGDLRAKAKHAIELRFRELLTESGNDLPRFYERVKQIAALPKSERDTVLAEAAARSIATTAQY